MIFFYIHIQIIYLSFLYVVSCHPLGVCQLFLVGHLYVLELSLGFHVLPLFSGNFRDLENKIRHQVGRRERERMVDVFVEGQEIDGQVNI